MFDKLVFPANTNLLNDALLKISTFDFIETGEDIFDFDAQLQYVSEDEPFSPAFEKSGLESTLFLSNESSFLLIIYANLFSLIAVFGLVWAIHRRFGILSKTKG